MDQHSEHTLANTDTDAPSRHARIPCPHSSAESVTSADEPPVVTTALPVDTPDPSDVYATLVHGSEVTVLVS